MSNMVKQLRENMGLTQTELAARASIGPRTLQTMEAGGTTRPPARRKVLQALGLVYQTDAGWVFGEEDTNVIVLTVTDKILNTLTEAVWNGNSKADWAVDTLCHEIVNALNAGERFVTLTETPNVPT